MEKKKVTYPNEKLAEDSGITLNTENGWDESNGQWYYYINGQMQTGWIKDSNGNWVYLQSNGVMVSNQWIEDKGLWYYLNSSGIMEVNSWVKDSKDGNWYYVGPNGAMEVSTTIDGYNLGPNGVATKIPVNSPYNAGEDDSITTELLAYQRFAREFGLSVTGSDSYEEIIPVSDTVSIAISLTIGDIVTTGNTLYTLNLTSGTLRFEDTLIDVGKLKAKYDFSLPNGKSLIDMIIALPDGSVKLSYDLAGGLYITIISNLYSSSYGSDKLSVKFGIQVIPVDNPDYGEDNPYGDDPDTSLDEVVDTLKDAVESFSDGASPCFCGSLLTTTATVSSPAPVVAINSLKLV